MTPPRDPALNPVAGDVWRKPWGVKREPRTYAVAHVSGRSRRHHGAPGFVSVNRIDPEEAWLNFSATTWLAWCAGSELVKRGDE